MRFLLDTNICIYIIKRQPPRVLQRLCECDITDVGISSITLSELEFGVEKSTRPAQNRLALAQFVAPLEILPYGDRAAAAYGRIRAALESKGKPIGALDTLIAAHALALGATLVTNNTREFRRVPDLPVENWAQRLA
ncbi:MAG: type II toxin-antitoxin system VapC family toxin [Candidatus Brocadiae bacterium]|nr:type II toxin-antitoxin system VapC family toxin [Candidatus Brocadiia bacterium]